MIAANRSKNSTYNPHNTIQIMLTWYTHLSRNIKSYAFMLVGNEVWNVNVSHIMLKLRVSSVVHEQADFT